MRRPPPGCAPWPVSPPCLDVWSSLRGPERALDGLARAPQQDARIDDAQDAPAELAPLRDELAFARDGAHAVDEADDAIDRHAEAGGLLEPSGDDEQVRRRRQPRLRDL